MDNSNTSRKNGSSAGGGGSASCWGWTNERHVHFLNSIEASFVRAMFDHHSSNSNANNRRYSLRLDRQLPDCFDSTRDVGKDRRRRHSISTSDAGEYSSSARTDKKSKRLSSHDQVVPQLENSTEDDDGIKAEKEREL